MAKVDTPIPGLKLNDGNSMPMVSQHSPSLKPSDLRSTESSDMVREQHGTSLATKVKSTEPS